MSQGEGQLSLRSTSCCPMRPHLPVFPDPFLEVSPDVNITGKNIGFFVAKDTVYYSRWIKYKWFNGGTLH